jgi:16S rRNA (guanine1516-N2)-methyltransferase
MKIAVTVNELDGPVAARAEALAASLSMPYSPLLSVAGDEYSLLLIVTAGGVSLQQTGKGAPGPLRVDFDSGKQAWRQRHGGGKSQLIARAVGLHKSSRPEVLDATAGLGGDSYVLAGLGCNVTMLEQSAVVAALLQDGLQRLAASPDAQLQAIADRLQLRPATRAEDYLARSNNSHQLIYLDPMFPGAAGSAAVKKEMQLLRLLLDQPGDEAQLLQLALEKASCRVVVKRHKQSPAIAGPAPSYQLVGKAIRYDIYSLRKYY